MSTDPLLDEAVRLADTVPDTKLANVLHQLVGRVRHAKDNANELRWMREQAAHAAQELEAERDAAQGKLDKVREVAEESRRTGKRLSALEVADILDGK